MTYACIYNIGRSAEGENTAAMVSAKLDLRDTGPGTPLYRQVKDAIVARIISGRWPEGTRLPSENELSAALDLSRMTVHRALRELTSEGWLERTQGAGTFVADAKPQSAVLEIRSIADEIKSRGHSHSAKVIHLRKVRAPALQGGLLGVKSGATLYHSLIVHSENGLPVQLEDRYVRPKAVPDYLAQDYTAITPYSYLIKVAPLTAAEHVIIAVKPTRREAELLKIKLSDPCLLLRRRTWSGEQPVSWVRLLHPGDRYRLGGESRGPGSGFDAA